MEAIRAAKISLGVDPLGGAGVHYWGPIAERYGLNLTVVNEAVDPTFRFMTVDWDGQIRMDPSSPYAMQRLIDLKDRFDIALACDTDHDRHGIVTRSAGLLPPNHYLAVAVFTSSNTDRIGATTAAVGKTVVSSQMIDRVTAKLGRKLYEVPVGFKWFVDGLLDGSLGFGGEESAGASFVRRDGTVWTTDKDGIVPALLSAEITARMDRDPGEIYRELTREFGEPVYDRVEASATPAQKAMLEKLSPQQVQCTDLAGEKIEAILTQAPGNGAPIGGLKVSAASGWFAARPSGTENIYISMRRAFAGRTICAASWRKRRPSSTMAGGGVAKRNGVARVNGAPMSNPKRVDSPMSVVPHGRRRIRFPGGACPGYAVVVESFRRRSVAGSLIRRSGSSLTIPGSFCRPSRGINSSACWPIPPFAERWMTWCRPSARRPQSPAWFQQNHPESPLTCVAYFSMEFMLSEALPIYSGGLGNVAGDQLKAASDLGVPVVGVGLLYQQGYFRQVIDQDGAQQALFPYNDPGQLPITPLRQPNGEWLRLELALPGYPSGCAPGRSRSAESSFTCWTAMTRPTFPAHRGITSELYGGGPELRLKQELLLGIGGWRLLHALGLRPEVCHLNEGHAAFAVLERARTFMAETGSLLKWRWRRRGRAISLRPTRAVAAGFDRFPPALIEQYLGGYAQNKLGIHSAICWPLAARTRTTRLSHSTWPIWRSAGAERSTA